MPDSPSAESESARTFLTTIFLFLFLANSAWAHSPAPACQFAQTVYGRMTFPKVEMVSRRHEFGLYRGGAIELSPWVLVGDHAYLGVSQDGRLLQVVDLGDRTVAFLLSGSLQITDLFLAQPATLIAMDKSGELYRFSWKKWSHSKLPEILRETKLWSAFGVCASAVVSALTPVVASMPYNAQVMALEFGLLSVSVIGNLSFFASVRFERDNEMTDGLIPLGKRIANYKTSEMIWDPFGRIIDYRLIGRGGSERLTEVSHAMDLQTEAKGFERNCEHRLLARGIPPEEYEPER